MCIVPQITDLDLSEVDTVAVDLETYDPGLKTKGSGAITGDGYVCGIAVATHKQTFYFPINHKYTDNLNADETWDSLNELIFQNEKITKVFHNAMYDVCWIRATTGLMLKGPIYDTMIAASVLDENRMKYSLDSLSKDYLDDTKYKWDLREKSIAQYGINDPMSNMHKLPYILVKDYAEQDVNLTFRLWNLFNKNLDEIIYEPKGKSPRKIFDLETRLFPCLVDMKFKGVKIDVEKTREFGRFLERRKQKLLRIIKDQTGININIWAAASIKKLLDKLKIKDYQVTPKSKMPKLPKDYLSTHKEVLLRLIAKARECEKANNAFVEGLLGFVHKGRIHADINQIRSDQGGTVTGRFSMSNPNLQQIPARGWIGKKMRDIFIPEDNHLWASFDYSQQEPRIVVHYAIKLLKDNPDLREENIPKKYRNKVKQKIIRSVQKMEDFYKENPDADFHQLVADMANIERRQAKTINLGMFYGMGKIKLQKELNLDKDEAKDLFNQYHAEVPFVKKLSEELIDFATDNELLFTLGDRFCRFNKWETTDKKWNSKIGRFDKVDLLTKQQAEKEYKAWLLEHADKNNRDKKEATKEKPNYQDILYYYAPAFTYKALNRLIQGSAADMTKTAMVHLYEQGILPHIQIHDELCISVKDDNEINNIKNIMESALPLKIKNKVTCKKGQSWGSAK
jgi:DNA polymerase I-like protein with 3'-5' exonuclease and polymerase domains